MGSPRDTPEVAGFLGSSGYLGYLDCLKPLSISGRSLHMPWFALGHTGPSWASTLISQIFLKITNIALILYDLGVSSTLHKNLI